MNNIDIQTPWQTEGRLPWHKPASDVSVGVHGWKRWYAVLYLMGLMGAFAVFEGADAQGGGGLSLSKVLFPPLYLISFALVATRWQALWKTQFPVRLALLFTGVFVSSMYCYLPGSALVTTISALLNCVFAWWLAQACEPEEFADLYLTTLVAMLVFAMLLAVVNFQYIVWVDPAERANALGLPNIKGAFPHKIHAAVFNAVGALISWSRFRARDQWRWAAAFGLFMLLVLASGSSLGIVTLAGVFIGLPALRAMHRRFGAAGLIWLVVLVVWLLATVLAYDLVALALSAVGRDATLTGRTTIWQFGLRYIFDHPFLGGGIGVFFAPYLNAPAYPLWQQMRWYVAPSFHNGYLQSLAECGLIGALPFLGLLGAALGRSFQPRMAPIVPILFGFALANTASSLFLAANSFFVVFLIYLWALHLRYREAARPVRRGLADLRARR